MECIHRSCDSVSYDDLSVSQRPASLVFRYDSEVNNGGHLQYFLNCGIERVEETIQALQALGAHHHAEILRAAFARWMSAARLPPADLMEFSAVASEGEFADLDDAFHELNLGPILERYVAERITEYVDDVPPDTADLGWLADLQNASGLPDRIRNILRLLLDHSKTKVRMKAAIDLFPFDKAMAEPVLAKIAEGDEWPTNLAAEHTLKMLREKF